MQFYIIQEEIGTFSQFHARQQTFLDAKLSFASRKALSFSVIKKTKKISLRKISPHFRHISPRLLKLSTSASPQCKRSKSIAPQGFCVKNDIFARKNRLIC
jgi:hypothetical protein